MPLGALLILIATASYAFVLVLLWRQYRHRFIGIWALGMGMMMLGATVQVAEEAGRAPAWYWAVSTFTMPVWASTLYFGARSVNGGPLPSRRTLAGLVALAAGPALAAPFFVEQIMLLRLPGTLIIAGAELGGGWHLRRLAQRSGSRGAWLAGWSLLLLGAVMVTYPLSFAWPALRLAGMLATGALALTFGVGTVILAHDYTQAALQAETQLLTAEVSRRTRELMQAHRLAAVGEAAAQVAHEVKNQLGVIDLSTVLITTDRPDEPALQAAGKRVRQAVRDLARLMRGLMQLGRLREGRRERFDLRQVIDEAVTTVVPADIQVSCSLPVQAVELVADRAWLQLLATHLLQHAMAAMPGGGTLSVSLSAGPPLVLRVADEGSGMTSQEMARVIERHFSNGRYGSDLELAIVRAVAERLGGSVIVESATGQGTAASVTLPVV